MKRARFLAQGRRHDGVLAEAGVLVDEAGVRHPEDGVTFLPPVVPQSVIGLALNFAAHADEMSLQQPPEPALFFKGPNTWVGHRAAVVQPAGVEYMHYEAELAVVIGRPARRVRAANAFDVVGGYTIANDITVRDFVTNTFRPPIKGKGWDTFCPFGPYLVTDEVEDPHALGLRAYVNGELRQEGSTSDFVRGIPELIEYVTEFMTLQPGDLILTGTPKGISHVYPGDTMRIEVDGLGALENTVVADPREEPA